MVLFAVVVEKLSVRLLNERRVLTPRISGGA